MSLHRTFTDTERAALRLHGLNPDGPSQLSDAFVLGMRHASQERCDRIGQACAEVFGWDKPAGVKACGSHQCIAAQRDGVLCADGECDRENGARPDGVEGRRS